MSARAARGAALEAATRAAEDSPSATDLSDYEGAAAAAPASAATACCCSGSLLSQRPAHSAHRPSRARSRGRARRLPAVVRVRNGRPGVPAGCLRAACRRSAACCWSSVSLPAPGPVCSRAVAATAPVLVHRPDCSVRAMFGDVWGCWGCWARCWTGAYTWLVVRFEWSTGFEFLTVSALPPAAFRCELTSQRQSIDHVGPDRNLVWLQRAPSARARWKRVRLTIIVSRLTGSGSSTRAHILDH